MDCERANTDICYPGGGGGVSQEFEYEDGGGERGVDYGDELERCNDGLVVFAPVDHW